jgi:hypothetical protein
MCHVERDQSVPAAAACLIPAVGLAGQPRIARQSGQFEPVLQPIFERRIARQPVRKPRRDTFFIRQPL